ncbi:glycoside hydrolase family 71/99-like protein [Sphingobacterium haloxyli]|uniref:Xylosidase n=1 Tax=Sphingobacterium haloxyli TaxID=2100533 RepID=A0A2S9J808_9SPHI|nr:glycoside hydrolase family 71/99-like protein [Sphingobacterium haloxyli]PRD48880.1 xylosidase [Sphingobacterium haloxyli]
MKLSFNLFYIIYIFFIPLFSQAQTKHHKTSAFKSYKGLIMTGYQGWFNTPQDGAGRGWVHYSRQGKFEQGFSSVDMWPDVSEYEVIYRTPFLKQDGNNAYVFSSYDSSSVKLHFKWMREYDIDGAFVQRFVTNLKGEKSLNQKNTVLKNALHAAKNNDRAISVMYDFSGMQDSDAEFVIEDWKFLVDSMKITNRGPQQSYLYHNQKPLVALWGVGFNDKRKYSLKVVNKIVDFLQNDPQYGNCSILIGVPTFWREQKGDAVKDTLFTKICKKADIIHPWFVGRFDEQGYPRFQQLIKKDLEWCRINKIDYVPVVFPGFSWHNMHPSSKSNHISRNRGSFYWKQLMGAIDAGANMIYVAMFDEIDEATAIFKIDQDPPVGKSVFVNFEEGLPSDYYLFLTKEASAILKKKKEKPKELPIKQALMH